MPVIHLPSIKQFLFILVLILGVSLSAGHAKTCTTVSSGVFTNGSNWSCTGGTAPPSLTGSDTIIIKHAMTLGSNLNITGNTVLTINSGGSLTVSGSTTINGVGVKVNVYGTLSSSGSITVSTGEVNIFNGGLVETTGAASNYAVSSSTGTSQTNIYSGGTLTAVNNITFDASSSTIVEYTGGTINAVGMSLLGTSTNTSVDLGGTVNLSGTLSDASGRKLNITGTVNANNFSTTAGTINVTGTMNLTAGFAVTGSATINLNGTFSMGGDFTSTSSASLSLGNSNITAQDMIFSGGAGITGSPTLNLRDLRFGYSNNPYGTSLNYSGTANLSGGSITLSRNFTSAGSATITLNASVSVGADMYTAGGNGITFNAPVTIAGNLYKIGASPININSGFTITGSAELTAGSGANDIVIGVTSNFKVTNLYATGNIAINLKGSMNVTNALKLGINSSGTMSGSVTITGTGVVAWASFNTNATSGTYIGCSSGSKYDGNTTGSSPYPDPPYNPLHLSTCSTGILPVTLNRFGTESDNGYVTVFWSTASEINTDYFQVERGDASGKFVSIGQVKATGGSGGITNYSFRDVPVLNRINYYRIRITDIDNHCYYTHIVAAAARMSGVLTIFPQPVTGSYFTALLPEVNEQTGTYYIISGTGKIMKTTTFEAGSAQVTIETDGLEEGFYLLKIITGNTMLCEKLYFGK